MRVRIVSTMFTVTLYLATLLATSVVSAKRKVCSPYPHVTLDHGTILRTGFQKYAFRCDKDYFLASSETVRCYRGNWTSSQEPKCLKIRGRCEEPPVVEHAKVLGDERHVGSAVTYMCEEGYTLLGHSMLTCSQDQYWDKLAPTCMDVNEPLETVAERLQNGFVNELEGHSADTPRGKSLHRSSLAKGLELFLLIDRSSSVDPVHLEEAKDFVKFLLERFAVRNGKNNKHGTRAEVLAFGTDVQTVFTLDDASISNPIAAAAALGKIQPNGGGTNIEDALTKVMLEIPKLRNDSKRALFLMTDGEPNVGKVGLTPEDLALSLKNNHHFEIFAVGIGQDVNVNFLNKLASEPPLSHVFTLDDYPDLKDVMKIIEDSKPPPPPISKDHCGYNATKENQPWMAALYIGGGPFKLCGGVLICSQWVLTSASCLHDGQQIIDKKDVFVVLGERHLLRAERGQTNYYVTDIRMHPHYDPRYVIENNLALLKLNLPDSRYRPACLPPTDRAIPLHLNLKINASIAGWGLTTASKSTYAKADDVGFMMNYTSVALSEEQECPIQKRGVSLLCAGQGSKTCYGLEGSPLMAEDSSTSFYHVLGILVDRRKCLRNGQNQYIELTDYIVWINEMTENCQLKHWGLSK